MKKLLFCTLLLLFLMGATSCSKENITIKVDEITDDTLLAKPDGTLQVATVEDFDKSYYNLGELEDFVKNQVNTYNKSQGKDDIEIDDVQLRGGKAIMLLTYGGMEPYSGFNEVKAAYFTGGADSSALELPATIINSKNNSLASTKEILSNNKYKILVIYEPYNIMVDGKVKYYSENAKLIDENTVKAASEGATIVVYKP